jgi:Patatin-like phospholipase
VAKNPEVRAKVRAVAALSNVELLPRWDAESVSDMRTSADACRVLSLDGGGAKGFYTLGVLKEIEAMVGQPICECFDLIFGTSTGGIIAGLLGYQVNEVYALYKQHVPAIMRRRNPRGTARCGVAQQRGVNHRAHFL